MSVWQPSLAQSMFASHTSQKRNYIAGLAICGQPDLVKIVICTPQPGASAESVPALCGQVPCHASFSHKLDTCCRVFSAESQVHAHADLLQPDWDGMCHAADVQTQQLDIIVCSI